MPTGLYNLDEFKDNCGFGLIAHLEGEVSHKLIKTAITALTCMTHRGAIGADGKTGDGCGLLMQKPDQFLRQSVERELGVELPQQYGVGSIMLSVDDAEREIEHERLETALKDRGFKVLCWRKVPINKECLGEIALASLPAFEQVFVSAEKNLTQEQFDAQLFIARRKAEIALLEHANFYIASLSSRVLSYKGLMMPADLVNFFPDLGDESMESAICVFHQRFSTNTLPRWPLAQPFRMLAHNGEINTVTGNRNWSLARTPLFKSELFGDPSEVAPLVNRTGSDSSSLDNMLEVLVLGGMELYRAVRMLVPPAWQNVGQMDRDLRAFYEYNGLHMEPWDGPAGLVITDGRYAVCTLDRNGLRPSRWVVTKDNFITVASEVGVYDYKPEDVVAKGRLGPGQILAVDTEEGKLLHTTDIDNQLKVRHPFKDWMLQNAMRIKV